MKVSAHSIIRAGLSVLTACSIAIALTVQPAPPPRPAPTVQLTGFVQPTALTPQQPLLNILLNSPLSLLGPAAPLGTLPPPPAPIQFAIAPNLANTVDAIYIAVEPWVQYGFEVATAVVRWIPYVGWFAGLIMDGYFFGESLVASGVFNITDFLRGDGGVVENLVDFGIDVGLAFVWLGLDALNSFIPLPPFCCYPPRPPVQGPFLASTMLLESTEAVEKTMLPLDAGAADQVEKLSVDLPEQEVVIHEEDVNDEEVLAGEEDATDEEELTTKEDTTDDVTPEVTDTGTTTTDSLGNVEAQGEVRGPEVDASPDADGTEGANGVDGAEGANGGDALDVDNADNIDNPAETAGTTDPGTGQGDNDTDPE